MRSRSVKPSPYPPLPFHGIRFIALLSAVIVAIILSVFTYNLHLANQKLPWAFLVLIISSFLSILNYVFTTIIHCCHGLPPRLSLITNTILLFLWFISLVLVAWSMSHTVLTTCNSTFWATSTGIAVCRIYKALFTFTVVGTAAQIAAVALDVTVHRRQSRLGEYDPMLDPAAASNFPLSAYKSHDRNDSVMSTSAFSSTYPADDDRHPLVAPHPHQRNLSRDDDLDLDGSHGGDLSSARRMPPPYSSANASLERFHAGEAQEFSDAAPARSQRGAPRVRFSVYDSVGYAHPAEQTSYDPTAYR